MKEYHKDITATMYTENNEIFHHLKALKIQQVVRDGLYHRFSGPKP